MAQLRCVTLIGDSNVKNHMSKNNTRDRPLMSGAQLIHCGRLSLLSTSLGSIRAESNVCILSCVTNFLTSASGSSSSASLRVEPVLGDFVSKISEVAGSRPDVSFLICPPMYRLTPIWYREGLPEVLQKFSDVMKSRPPNCHMMPSFPTPAFEADGVHLTAYSGFEFVLHLFDSMTDVIQKLELPQEALTTVMSESSRVLEDRVMVLEQDHRRLNRKFEMKIAIDAELSDFQENLRNESFLMIQGLPRLPKLEPKEWQVQAKAAVQDVLKRVMGKEYPVVFVQNSTGRGKEARTTYRVKMPSAEISKEIRDKFGDFFNGGKGDTRPPDLKHISVRNAVTAATLARLAILQLLGSRYHDSNPGSKIKAIGYESRPLLKLTPPSSTSDPHPRVQTYNFIEAITSLPTSFSNDEISELLKRISPKLHGSLKPLLVVVSDDMVKKSFPPKGKASVKNPAKGKGASKGATSGSESSSSFKSPGAVSSRSAKRGASESPSGPSAKK